MPYISQSSIERIKEADLLTVVRHWVDLKKSGANYVGKSPWNENEKTPSFYVIPAKNMFKDHSTGKGGIGAINFAMQKQGVDFIEAVKIVAGIVNERIEYDEHTNDEEYKKLVEEKELLYKINEAAARKFSEQLDKALKASLEKENEVHAAVKEITKRNFTPETITAFELGYAPDQWQYITDLVGDKNRQPAMDLGLITEKDGRTYDTFRHRFIYPIHDHQGRVVAFGGRALDRLTEGDQKGYKEPKYINSHESKIYLKSYVLYGLHHAAEAIRKAGYCYLMEGYTDVVSMHQAGYNVSVATCGTALTETQCVLLRKYCSKVVLFRDGDEAGQKATLRDIDLLVANGFDVAVVPMPVFEDGRKVDPDDLTRMWKPVEVIKPEKKQVQKKAAKSNKRKPKKS
ncbi:MAG: DNA primase [Cyclobacteriaceae bacterium]|nr:DNA primase [Cyclobacteriaceae bacterium]